MFHTVILSQLDAVDLHSELIAQFVLEYLLTVSLYVI